MRISRFTLPLAGAALLASFQATAQDPAAVPTLAPSAATCPCPPPAPPPPIYKGTAELSWVQTSGNSSSQSLGAALDVQVAPDAWKFGLKAAYLRQEQNDVESTRRFATSLRAGRMLSDRFEVFVQGNYMEDRYAGLDHLTSFEGGVSYGVLLGPVHALSADAGIGYTWESRLNLSGAPNDDLSYGSVRLGAKYQWNWSKTAFFKEEPGFLLDLQHSSNWKFYNQASINAGLTSLLSLKLGWTLTYQNQPAAGKVKTDNTTAAAIVASF